MNSFESKLENVLCVAKKLLLRGEIESFLEGKVISVSALLETCGPLSSLPLDDDVFEDGNASFLETMS